MFLSNKPIVLFAPILLLFINNVSTETTMVPDNNDVNVVPKTPISNNDEATRTSRIIGGETDRYDEIKHSVALHDGYQDFCGGSIIADRFVLTAAHCVIGLDNRPTHNPLYTVIGGTNKLLRDFRDRVPKVAKIFVPSSFDGSREAVQPGDIALLRLDRPVRLGDDVRIAKVNLPKNVPYGTWESYEGQTATISGFGAHWIDISPNRKGQTVEIGDRSFPGQLLIARADILPQTECEDIFSSFFSIHMVQMCAQMQGTDYRGVCTGDAGNGLILDNTIIAVASFGNGMCNETSTPTVYTRVAPFMHFIEMAMVNAPTDDYRVYNMFE